ncbi:CAP domain-containing protein [Streptomyces olivaceus]|uniref:CAP domain-containing protein n=1 Tax=Streptomyces olivaceus TaxID=47716 RepID=UPI001CCAC9C0|nr:CAP domain-containing protein [Streptomyces olivaceus]MBZ6287451.1 CAP domain-containing protein [Streptomyces olivaceus]
MGRHRRSAAGRAATGRAAGDRQTDATTGPGHGPQDPVDRTTMGIAPYLNPEAYAEVRARSDAYLYADAPDGEGPRAARTVAFPSGGYAPESGGPQPPDGHRRRRKKAATPVRTGLLGVSAAVALGTVAVATGAVPGLDNYRIGGGSGGGDRVQARDTPTNSPSQQGGTSGSADTGRGDDATASRGGDRSSSPSRSSSSDSSPSDSSSSSPDKDSSSPSRSSDESSAPASKPAAPAGTPSKTGKPDTPPSTDPKPAPSRSATKEPARPSAPASVSEQAAAEAQVLKLVNDERAKVGCSPVAANSALRELAEDFSGAMAAQGFFDHTDPSGATPWDRAAAAGISGLGGENIARGQADAQAVMDAWMDSPGHRANILNCDFQTLGVGVHFGSGGPWWTQDFGY